MPLEGLVAGMPGMALDGLVGHMDGRALCLLHVELDSGWRILWTGV